MEKEQFKESLPYWFETEEYKQFSKLAHNNFGGKPSMETLEEAAKTFATRFTSRSTPNWESFKLGFIEGAKWQQERMYSEAIEFAEWIRIKDFQTASKDNWIGLDMKYFTTEELFEQFKKK